MIQHSNNIFTPILYSALINISVPPSHLPQNTHISASPCGLPPLT